LARSGCWHDCRFGPWPHDRIIHRDEAATLCRADPVKEASPALAAFARSGSYNGHEEALLAPQSTSSLGSVWGARLRWAARADDELTANEGGDPSGTYKRWFGRVSGRAGWWRGSSLVNASYWPGGPRGVRAGSLPRARPCPTDGRSNAVAARTTLVRG
jgi:hypothetical protein